jgi:hypothetical protein
MKKMILIIICLLFSGIYCDGQYTVTTNVKTPNNNTVLDTRTFTGTDYSYSTTQLAAMAADLQANYNAELISAPSKKYNCHAYAWHVSEGGSQVWIGYSTSTAEDIYWTDESYMEVNVCNATKVSYDESGNHSAIKLDNTWYQSKWGDGPLVKHYLNNVPSGYKPSLQKKYYLRTPTISGPSLICTSGTFTVNNLPPGTTVSWDESANLTEDPQNPGIFSANGSGEGWVEATLTNGCGEITLSRKEVWAGAPLQPYDIWFTPSTPCLGQIVIAQARANNPAISGTTYEWRGTYDYDCQYPACSEVHFTTISGPLPYGSYVRVKATNTCGSSAEYSEYLWVQDCGGGLPPLPAIVITPNPATGETLLSIETSPEETGFDIDEEWGLEIYNSSQMLKEKKTKLKGNEYRFNTSGWKDGVYMVRVNYKNEILTGK